MEESYDDDDYYSEMGRSGSFACLSKKTITNCLECLISCLILMSAIYIALLILGFIFAVKGGEVFHSVGYISLIVCFSAPIGLYGSRKSNYTALIIFLVLVSYHLYGLLVYIWFAIRDSSLFNAFATSRSNNVVTNSKGVLNLHEVSLTAYSLTVLLTIFMTVFKLISSTLRLEPAKVIVVDNNPLD